MDDSLLRELADKALHFGLKVVFAIVTFLIGVQVIKLIRRIVQKALTRANAEKGVLQFLDSLLKVVLYVILVFLIATSFGVSVAGVVTLLGSAGVAIGLSLQGSLSNLAGGVLILLLKPFKVGDYIIEDTKGNEGTVTEIQMFYTKLTTPDGKVIVLPNGTLANNSLTNVTANPERRVDLKIGIAYSADLKKAKEVAEQVVRTQEHILQEQPVMVFVDSLGDSEVVLGVRCYVPNSDYWDVRWALTERLKLAFDENGIEIPFPQLDVHTKA
ncbi:MAG: mechanosensitive ion channel family protein [Lachnospiraceae bacterium]|nr:mechanosensitive ion channel family protein [Lachnospiraceae bacterium]MBD5481220.1 mechanosensitive ion channel family protein [Lachnospiraceae bacterium]